MQAKSDIVLESYPSRVVLDLIADKWRPIVLYILGQGTKRYSDLQRQLPGVSKKMLTQTLRRLEQDGLLTRKVFPVVPPRVEYTLTRLGQTFWNRLLHFVPGPSTIKLHLMPCARIARSEDPLAKGMEVTHEPHID